nr:MAG TPA: hypothetical protein [Caudoviricetes sp.]
MAALPALSVRIKAAVPYIISSARKTSPCTSSWRTISTFSSSPPPTKQFRDCKQRI